MVRVLKWNKKNQFNFYFIFKVPFETKDEATVLRLVHTLSSQLDLILAILFCMDSLIKILLICNVYKTLLLASLACLPRSHHITPVLMNLPWLSVKFCAIYKILCELSKLKHVNHLHFIWTCSPLFLHLDFTIISTVIAFKYKSFFHFKFKWPQIIFLCHTVHIRQASSLQCFKSLLKTNFFKAAYL